MKTEKYYYTAALFLLPLCFPGMVVHATPFDDLINNAPINTWIELPNTNLDSVAPIPVPPGTAGVKGVMSKWCGATYDTKRDRLIVWGGGHRGYAGNELYGFDVNNMRWSRITEPTPIEQIIENVDVYADGNPSARHTYDSMAYIPEPFDVLYGRGSATYGSQPKNSPYTWIYEFKNKKWVQTEDHPDHRPSELTDYDFISGNVYSHGKNYLSVYSPKTNTWSIVSNRVSREPLDGNASLDPVRRKFVRIGGGVISAWDIISTNPPIKSELTTTGESGIINAIAPGFVYDPVSDKFVAWDGFDPTGAIYTLDMDTLIWKKILPATEVKPFVDITGEFNGIFGRFQYIPSKNVFLAVSYTNQNVYIYKLNNIPPIEMPAKPSMPTATGNTAIMNSRLINVD